MDPCPNRAIRRPRALGRSRRSRRRSSTSASSPPTRVGFGDSEALYASYALHPQPAYLDHPGLVGLVARVLGGGTRARPRCTRTSSRRSWPRASPWVMALACRAARRDVGVARSGTALVVALVPEIAVGLFAMTPDLLLAFAWTAALGARGVGLRSRARRARARRSRSRRPGCSPASRRRRRSAGCCSCRPSSRPTPRVPRGRTRARSRRGRASPPACSCSRRSSSFEARTGWPMLRHRLVDTQSGAGLSLRNAGALVGGQLAYLSPLVAVPRRSRGARGVARPGRRDRHACCSRPARPRRSCSCRSASGAASPSRTGSRPRCSRSRRRPPARRRPRRSGSSSRLRRAGGRDGRRRPRVGARAAALRLAPASYDPRLDLANELYGWPEVARAPYATRSPRRPRPGCERRRRRRAALGDLRPARGRRCGATSPSAATRPVRDDFDAWWPRRAGASREIHRVGHRRPLRPAAGAPSPRALQPARDPDRARRTASCAPSRSPSSLRRAEALTPRLARRHRARAPRRAGARGRRLPPGCGVVSSLSP